MGLKHSDPALINWHFSTEWDLISLAVWPRWPYISYSWSPPSLAINIDISIIECLSPDIYALDGTELPSSIVGLTLIYYFMTVLSNGNIFHVTGHLCGEFTGPCVFPAQRPVTRSTDVFCDLCLNKQLSKQSWGWWFEMPSLWRHCNVYRWLCLAVNIGTRCISEWNMREHHET